MFVLVAELVNGHSRKITIANEELLKMTMQSFYSKAEYWSIYTATKEVHLASAILKAAVVSVAFAEPEDTTDV